VDESQPVAAEVKYQCDLAFGKLVDNLGKHCKSNHEENLMQYVLVGYLSCVVILMTRGSAQ